MTYESLKHCYPYFRQWHGSFSVMVAFQLFITGVWSRQWRLIVNSTYSSRQNYTNYCLLKIFFFKVSWLFKKGKRKKEREKKKRILHLSAYIIQPNCYRILYSCKCLTSDFSIKWLIQVWLSPPVNFNGGFAADFDLVWVNWLTWWNAMIWELDHFTSKHSAPWGWVAQYVCR